MAEISKIKWTNSTFNPWIGCSRVSPGCQNCYAENLMANRYRRVEWGPGKPRSRTKTWKDPIKWNKACAYAGCRQKVFCASLADWLDEEVPAQWREDLFELIESCPNLDWLMLTKRPQNARQMLPQSWLDNPLSWVWFGVTAENQQYWDMRVPILTSIPATIHWVSYEPSLGPLTSLCGGEDVDWLIIGGESDQASKARPFVIEWAEKTIADCRMLAISPFVKQIGSNAAYHGSPFPTRDNAGTDWNEWPKSICVREFPKIPLTPRS